jgi:hypothetical protein
MPKARQTKRSGSASSGKSEKRVKRVNKIPTGENKAGLTPAIPFCDDAVKDVNDTDDKYVSIKVKIDQDKADSRVNLEDKKFLEITNLTYNGAMEHWSRFEESWTSIYSHPKASLEVSIPLRELDTSSICSLATPKTGLVRLTHWFQSRC